MLICYTQLYQIERSDATRSTCWRTRKDDNIFMAKIKKYKKKNGEIAYKFHVYLGKDPLTGKEIKLIVVVLKQDKRQILLYLDCF